MTLAETLLSLCFFWGYASGVAVFTNAAQSYFENDR
jgi:hypothetical protein